MGEKLVRWLIFGAAVVAAVLLSRMAWQHGQAQMAAERGWKEFRAGRISPAIGAFRKADSIRPDYALALQGLGESYFLLYRAQPQEVLLEQAEGFFKRALLAFPGDARSAVRLRHIRAIRSRNDKPRVAAEYDAAARLAVAHLGYMDLQRAFIEMAGDSAVFHWGDGLLVAERRLPVIKSAQALFTARLVTIDELAELLGVDFFTPRESMAFFFDRQDELGALVNHVMKNGRWDLEGSGFIAAARELGMEQFVVRMAQTLAGKDRRKDAVDLLIEYLLRHPTDAAAHRLAGEYAQGAKEYDWNFAAGQLKQAVDLEPENADYLWFYAVALFNHHDDEGARREMGKLTELRPTGAVWYYLGQVEERSGGSRAALEAYGKAIEFEPNNKQFRDALEKLNKK